MLKDLSLEEYIQQVDSDNPTPGGGSVASLVGALGAALNRMLAHLSLNKKKFKEASHEKQELFAAAANDIKVYQEALMDGIDGDALSYECVMTAYRLKDENEIQRALKTSAFIAVDIQKNAFMAMQRIPELIELGNKSVLSDLVAGTILLQSCVEISFLNVKANASLLSEEKERITLLEEGNTYVEHSKQLKEEILKRVNK